METTPKEFWDYLESFHGNEVVGRRGEAERCPLANWYTARGLHEVSVGMGDVLYKTAKGERYTLKPLEAWELQFRTEVDALVGKKIVTVGMAKRILRAMGFHYRHVKFSRRINGVS